MSYKVAVALGHLQSMSVDVFSPQLIPTLENNTYNVGAIQIPEGLLLIVIANQVKDEEINQIIDAFMRANLPQMYQEWKETLDVDEDPYLIISVPLIVSPHE